MVRLVECFLYLRLSCLIYNATKITFEFMALPSLGFFTLEPSCYATLRNIVIPGDIKRKNSNAPSTKLVEPSLRASGNPGDCFAADHFDNILHGDAVLRSDVLELVFDRGAGRCAACRGDLLDALQFAFWRNNLLQHVRGSISRR